MNQELYLRTYTNLLNRRKYFIMLLARAKLKFLREEPDDFFSVGNPAQNIYWTGVAGRSI